MINNTPEELLAKIKSVDTIAMSLHRTPDGDSLGSSCALAYIFEKHFDKKVTIVSPDETGDFLGNFLSFHDIQIGKALDDVEADLYVVCDGTWLGRFGVEKDIPHEKLLFVDHHNSEKTEGPLSYVFPNQSSTCSIVFDLARAWNIPFDQELAKRIILGMFTDTGGFKFGKSLTEDIHKLDALLTETELDYQVILEPLTAVSLKYKKLSGLVMHNLEISGTFGISCLPLADTQKMGLNKTEIRGGIGAIQDIKEIDLACTLTEIEPNMIKGSFRARTGDKPRLFAEQFGGGGHDKAAAFILENTTLDDAKKMVLELVQKN